MNINDIKKYINDLPICDKGKIGVSKLVAAITGNPEIVIFTPQQGEVWLQGNGRIVFITDDGVVNIDEPIAYDFTVDDCALDPCRRGNNATKIGYYNSASRSLEGKRFVERLASTLEEYFKNRESIRGNLKSKYVK